MHYSELVNVIVSVNFKGIVLVILKSVNYEMA